MWRWFEHHQVYHPDRILIATGAELGRPFEELSLKTSDRIELHGWFYPANQDSPRAKWAALVCHGNAGNISHRLELCAALLQSGLNVLLFDYRGYGRSGGRASEEGTYLDAKAAYEWLRRRGFAGANMIAFGESLGGGIATELALRKQVGGLVLESSFSCIFDLAAEINRVGVLFGFVRLEEVEDLHSHSLFPFSDAVAVTALKPRQWPTIRED